MRLSRAGSRSKKILQRIVGRFIIFGAGGRKNEEEKEGAEGEWRKVEVKANQRNGKREIDQTPFSGNRFNFELITETGSQKAKYSMIL